MPLAAVAWAEAAAPAAAYIHRIGIRALIEGIAYRD